MVLVARAKKIAWILILTVLFITVSSLAARFIMYMWGAEGFLKPVTLFDVGAESNIPTWYSSFTLLLCSVLLAMITLAKKWRGDRYTLHWGVLSAIFLLLSIDEVASLHEATGQELQLLVHELTGFTPGGIVSFFWVVPGSVFVLVVLLAYLGFVAHLPRDTRRLFVLAGALFVFGALGLEMLSAQVVSSYGLENWENVGGMPKIVVGLQTSVEEMLEMLGVVTFIYALLSYMSS